MADVRFGNDGLVRLPFRSRMLTNTAGTSSSLGIRSSKITAKNASFQNELNAQMKGLAAKPVLKAADKYLGVPYEMGGGRGKGAMRTTDCSAFVSRVYSDATNGRAKLTPYTDAMYDETTPISPSEAQPGDLIFYKGTDTDQPGTRFPHVAIYAGNGQVVDASSMLGRVGYHQISIGKNYQTEYRRVRIPGDQTAISPTPL